VNATQTSPELRDTLADGRGAGKVAHSDATSVGAELEARSASWPEGAAKRGGGTDLTAGVVEGDGALGRLTGYCPTSQNRLEGAERLLKGYQLRTALREVAADRRIAVCGTVVYTDPQLVCTEYIDGSRSARWSGVVLCNRAGCPVCAATRARRFGEAVERTVGAGGRWQHVTLTVPHRSGESWSVVYERALAGVRELSKGASGRIVRGLVEATIRATESTWSVRSGWHVHFHVIWKVSRPLEDAEKAVIAEQWATRTGADVERGVRFGASFATGEAAAKYVSKLAWELSGAHKRAQSEHWTIGEVYERAANGDVRFVGLVREYQRATKGRRLYQFDRRARQMHDGAPELPGRAVVAEYRVSVLREEFSGLSRCERRGTEKLAIYLPLEAAITARGDPSDYVRETVDAILRTSDAQCVKISGWLDVEPLASQLGLALTRS
jgi:hypothetical protein